MKPKLRLPKKAIKEAKQEQDFYDESEAAGRKEVMDSVDYMNQPEGRRIRDGFSIMGGD